ncbi:hypothetical protein NP493_242g01048 [Ridgeia piscesae]|uniref:NTF2 domain-containing protein n=1 Tax=Ridgeia piscesae TaxID=27915 RepID=A0AAD9NYM6_RIDPI|nr:hypothetical protein NP493_242g01048 [Ridgeia piscesae]
MDNTSHGALKRLGLPVNHDRRDGLEPQRWKIIRGGSAPVPLTEDTITKLKVCMSKRYDPATKTLNLENLYYDTDLSSEGIHMVLSRRTVMSAVITIIKENIPELVSLGLSNNKLYNIDLMSTLHQAAPDLIRTQGYLAPLEGMNLIELRLAGNPLCDAFSDDAAYVRYYMIYDSSNRNALLDAYHEQVTFSMMYMYNRGQTRDQHDFSAYHRESRNLKKLLDPVRRQKNLRCGRASVVSLLSELPVTRHDPASYVIDVNLASPAMLNFTVHGLYEEVGGKTKGTLRAFSRLFIAVPQGAGVAIINEELFITNPTAKQQEATSSDISTTPVTDGDLTTTPVTVMLYRGDIPR